MLIKYKMEGSLDSYPKLKALYAWLQQVKDSALSNSLNFSSPPFTFEEVVSEIPE